MMSNSVYQWTCNNKLLMLLGVICFCLLVSTLSVSAKLKNAEKQLQAFKITDKKPQSTPIERINDEKDPAFYRLPRHVVPNNYKLFLKPNMLTKTFNGTVEIIIRVLERTSSIALHAHKLNIKSVNLKTAFDKNLQIEAFNATNDKRELLNIHLKSPVHAGLYHLFIEFSGRLDKGIVGIYSSTLKNSE